MVATSMWSAVWLAVKGSLVGTFWVNHLAIAWDPTRQAYQWQLGGRCTVVSQPWILDNVIDTNLVHDTAKSGHSYRKAKWQQPFWKSNNYLSIYNFWIFHFFYLFCHMPCMLHSAHILTYLELKWLNYVLLRLYYFRFIHTINTVT